MKILVISEALGEPNHKRGIFHFTRELIRSLTAEGHELTLVVETTNLRNVDERHVGVWGTTETGKIIERFTRLGPDVMDYQVTVDDPQWYTASWTASIPMSKVKGPLYEYACHEGNYGLPNILAGHRKEERDAAAKAGGQQQ